ncbi:hypothetical protein BGZ98_008808 [Dissophora globulifera]|nr:hypothetical protein BGZ98_008808 [Dissophora globulifera]
MTMPSNRTLDNLGKDHIKQRPPPSGIFPRNLEMQPVKTTLPNLGSRIESTSQLVYCNSLILKDKSVVTHSSQLKETLDMDRSQGQALNEYELAWLATLKKNPFEKERIQWLAVMMVQEFTNDELKDVAAAVAAEVVHLGPILDRRNFRKLFNYFISRIGDEILLDVDLLQGLVQLVQGASPGHLEVDDLIQALRYFRIHFENTQQLSTESIYHLILAVARIVDVIVHSVDKNSDIMFLYEQLEPIISGLKNSSDPYLMYQVSYTFQACQYLVGGETPLQAVMQKSMGVADGHVDISGLTELDLAKFLKGLKALQKEMKNSCSIIKAEYGGEHSTANSGHEPFESLKKDIGFGCKQLWYIAIQGAEALPPVAATLREFQRRRLQEQGQRNAVYIPLQAKASREWHDDELIDLAATVNEFLASDQKVLLILGDSGAGKSTFNLELERDLWDAYEKDKKRIPVFVNLPTIDKPDQDLIAKHLRTYDFNEEQIQELKSRYEFVLICDGYDECQQEDNLYTSNRLNRAGGWSVQMVITCRSEYLGHDYRRRFQPGDRNDWKGGALLREVVIAPFSKSQIRHYIEKYVDKNASHWKVEDYLGALDRIPGLQDLLKNPFLLTLSLWVLPKILNLGNDLPSTTVTRVALYDEFVEHWIDRGMARLQNKKLRGDDVFVLKDLCDDGFSYRAIQLMKDLAVAIFENQDGAPSGRDPDFEDLICGVFEFQEQTYLEESSIR